MADTPKSVCPLCALVHVRRCCDVNVASPPHHGLDVGNFTSIHEHACYKLGQSDPHCSSSNHFYSSLSMPLLLK